MQLITDTLAQIAPYMVYAGDAAIIILAAGLLTLLVRICGERCNSVMRLASRLMILLGIVFLIYQAALFVTGTSPAGNSVFYGYSFGLLAALLLVIGIPLRVLASLKPTR